MSLKSSRKFSQIDSIIYHNWILNKPLCDIATLANVTESIAYDIIQKINNKMDSTENRIATLEELGLIKKMNYPKRIG